MQRVVLTGGPCSGKTTVQRVLRETFAHQLAHVPEAATILLAGGFPAPGPQMPWSETWQASLQRAVLTLQYSLEDICLESATTANMVILDRGLLDGAAYTPGGVTEFCRRFDIDLSDAMTRYDIVIHLESMATADPDQYGRSNNAHRFEPLEEAQRLELAVREAWASHPRQVFVKGDNGVDGKVAEVCGLVRELLEEHV